MMKIDPQTVQRILDSADIVEVVSDFVSLKRRGANYVGLCPFHNERTPSFSVSKSKGICKCFSCGKGGSPVNFLMELEQISYQEALRYLAKKYNIEIRERELTDQERQEANDRESLFAINDMALEHFRRNLTETDDGRDIGLAYFYERGINDWAINRFKLGYSLPNSTALIDEAHRKGFSDKYLTESGLAGISSKDGKLYDKYRGRVIYPIFTLSGKVVGFGGRTLRKDKDVAKYINSPENAIYHKSSNLYGLYQAKQAIAKADRCILVEGYMDVISMHQSGVENVVASSGTSLTDGQIKLIHRFTPNVTVIYDSDPAGIKASLRGINMLLAEGMDVKVVLLPDGDDPDSFAQSHSTTEIEEYLKEHATDFISFKTKILLEGTANDPAARSRVITDIVESISVIPDLITRTVYTRECSLALGIDEKVLTLQVEKFYRIRRDKEAVQAAKDKAAATLAGLEAKPDTRQSQRTVENTHADSNSLLRRYERRLLRYVVKYGMLNVCMSWSVDGEEETPIRLIDYVDEELAADGISFQTPVYAKTYTKAKELCRSTWVDDERQAIDNAVGLRQRLWDEGVGEIRNQSIDLSDIKSREVALTQRCDKAYDDYLTNFTANYISSRLASDEDDEIRLLTADLVAERYQLSRVHTKYAQVPTEMERLPQYVERAVYELKDVILQCRGNDLRARLSAMTADPSADVDAIASVMRQIAELNQVRAQFAKYLGERIIAPRK